LIAPDLDSPECQARLIHTAAVVAAATRHHPRCVGTLGLGRARGVRPRREQWRPRRHEKGEEEGQSRSGGSDASHDVSELSIARATGESSEAGELRRVVIRTCRRIGTFPKVLSDFREWLEWRRI